MSKREELMRMIMDAWYEAVMAEPFSPDSREWFYIERRLCEELERCE